MPGMPAVCSLQCAVCILKFGGFGVQCVVFRCVSVVGRAYCGATLQLSWTSKTNLCVLPSFFNLKAHYCGSIEV